MKEIRFACGYPCYIILNAHRSSVMNKITSGYEIFSIRWI